MTVSVLVLLSQLVSPKRFSSSWIGHDFSDKLVNTVHNSNPRYGLILKQSLNQNFNTISSVVIANFYVRDWAKAYIALDPPFGTSSEASDILGIKIDLLLLLLL